MLRPFALILCRLALVLPCCLSLVLFQSPTAAQECVFSEPADECPSDAAQKMDGAIGKKGFTATELGLKTEIHGTTYWYDTDGVSPGVAGCHIGVTDGSDRREKNGRTFGEACVSETILIESNPGALVVHGHKGDHGHPDLFNCVAWCEGNGKSSGRCEVVTTGLDGCAKSARCACD